MLSFLPKFEVGDFVYGPFPYQVKIFRIESIRTKMLFFHTYTVSRVDSVSYTNPGMSMDILQIFLQIFPQRKLTKLDYYDIVTFFSTMMYAQFGESKRTGKPWTEVESEILEELYPKLQEFDKPEIFQIDLETIFGRSIRAIETQYKKVSKQ